MKKKIAIIVLLIIVIIAIFYIIRFTSFGQKIVSNLYFTYGIPKETIEVQQPETINVFYKYQLFSDDGIEIEIADREIIEPLIDSISNRKLNNETKAGIMLDIIGRYTIDLENGVKLKFDNCNDVTYIKLQTKEKEFITQINTEAIKKITDIIDLKLEEDAKIYNTNKVTITKNNDISLDINRKSAINYILDKCKNIYYKKDASDIVESEADYYIDFNNGVSLAKYSYPNNSYIIKDKLAYIAYGVEELNGFMEYISYDVKEKEEIFSTDKIIIMDHGKSINLVDNETIEKITTAIVFSDIQEREWLNSYDITEEYNNSVKIKINDYEFLIPNKIGNITNGNRYVISTDGKIKLWFPLYDLEEYVNELLGNQNKKPKEIVTTQVP